jgi:hypothetical protein
LSDSATTTSAVFRSSSPSTPAESAPPQTVDTTTTGNSATNGQLLYTYEDEHKHPFTADYYQLAEFWNEKDGQSAEAKKIETHLKELVTEQELENSTTAAREYLKELEKKAGVEKSERTLMKLTKVAAYIDFLQTIQTAKQTKRTLSNG